MTSHRPERGVAKLHQVTLLLLTVCGVFTVTVYAATNCLQPDLTVDVVVYVPPGSHIGEVRLFSLEGLQFQADSQIVTDHWSGARAAAFYTFDVSEMLFMRAVACDRDRVCPAAALRQGVVGCNPPSRSCVCPRGFVLNASLQICTDRNECAAGVQACPPEAVCRNTNGSHSCTCPHGFYHSQHSCTACSGRCPDGQYQSLSCSGSHDRVCSDCDECSGAMYEVQPCRALHNTQCIHAAHPLLVVNNVTLSSVLKDFQRPMPVNPRRKRLRVESYTKVFLENLHRTTNLETTYYVTNAKQSTDFFWYRSNNSVRINIGLQNIHLIPHYRDAEHASDNAYAMSNPGSAEEQERFKDILANHCRHPVPDQYAVTLEISKDRTTAAKMETCTGELQGRGLCPEGARLGDSFLQRSLNEPCRSMGSYPENLSPGPSSVVCSDPAELLTSLFNLSATEVRPVAFPPRECRLAASHCDRCLEQDKCITADLFRRQCCHVDCYTQPDCRLARSQRCQQAPVHCAMGDAYRYTLQPIFSRVRDEFRCHVRHAPPVTLYQLWFYLSLPEVGFETERVRVTVTPRDVASVAEGRYDVGFLTIEHHAGLQLHDDFILVGKSTAGKWSHSIYPLHAEAADTNGASTSNNGASTSTNGASTSMSVHSISNDVHVLSTQFDEPFAYSTSSWVPPAEGDDCRKDVKRFRPVHDPAAVAAQEYAAQRVNVITVAEEKKAYEYWLKAALSPPHMKFIIPANSSVLSWWFRDAPAELITTGDSAVSLSLSLSSDERTWLVNISGQTTHCPAYLSIILSDRVEHEELFRYDVLFPCPPSFNLSFVVPTLGGGVTRQLKQPTKTFDVEIDDAKTVHRTFVTYLSIEATNAGDSEKMRKKSAEVSEVGIVLAVGILLVALSVIVILGSIYVSLVVAQRKAEREMFDKVSGRNLNWKHCDFSANGDVMHQNNTGAQWTQESFTNRDQVKQFDDAGYLTNASLKEICSSGNVKDAKNIDDVARSQKRKRVRSICISFYILAKLAYSTAFTFTAISTLVGVCGLSRKAIDLALQFTEVQSRYVQTVSEMYAMPEKLLRSEQERQAKQSNRVRGACDAYVDDLLHEIHARMRKHYDDAKAETFEHNSISVMLSRIANRTLERYRVEIARYARDYSAGVEKGIGKAETRYASYLRRVWLNTWLLYAQRLFNETAGGEWGGMRGGARLSGGSQKLGGIEAEFVGFLHLHHVNDVQNWQAEFSRRSKLLFRRLFSTTISFALSQQTALSSHCHLKPILSFRAHHDLGENSKFASPVLSNSTRFFAASSDSLKSALTFDDDGVAYDDVNKDQLDDPIYFAEEIRQPEKIHRAGRKWEGERIPWGVFWIICCVLDFVMLARRLVNLYDSVRRLNSEQRTLGRGLVFATPLLISSTQRLLEVDAHGRRTVGDTSRRAASGLLSAEEDYCMSPSDFGSDADHEKSRENNFAFRSGVSNCSHIGNHAITHAEYCYNTACSADSDKDVVEKSKCNGSVRHANRREFIGMHYQVNTSDQEERSNLVPCPLHSSAHHHEFRPVSCPLGISYNSTAMRSSALGSSVTGSTLSKALGESKMKRNLDEAENFCDKFCCSQAVPRVVAILLVIFLLLLVMKSANQVLCCELLLDLNGLSKLRRTWQQKYTAISEDLRTAANESAVYLEKNYQGHVIFELSHLSIITDLLQKETDQRQEIYRQQACAFRSAHRYINHAVCLNASSTQTARSRYELPIIPCGFVRQPDVTVTSLQSLSPWKDIPLFSSVCSSSLSLIASLSNLILVLLSILVVLRLLDLVFVRAFRFLFFPSLHAPARPSMQDVPSSGDEASSVHVFAEAPDVLECECSCDEGVARGGVARGGVAPRNLAEEGPPVGAGAGGEVQGTGLTESGGGKLGGCGAGCAGAECGGYAAEELTKVGCGARGEASKFAETHV